MAVELDLVPKTLPSFEDLHLVMGGCIVVERDVFEASVERVPLPIPEPPADLTYEQR